MKKPNAVHGGVGVSHVMSARSTSDAGSSLSIWRSNAKLTSVCATGAKVPNSSAVLLLTAGDSDARSELGGELLVVESIVSVAPPITVALVHPKSTGVVRSNVSQN